jgi:transposase
MSRKALRPDEIRERLGRIDQLTARGWSLGEAVKSLGVSEAAYLRWCGQHGAASLAEQVRRVKHLEAENARLRQALADHRLDRLILQRVIETRL